MNLNLAIPKNIENVQPKISVIELEVQDAMQLIL